MLKSIKVEQAVYDKIAQARTRKDTPANGLETMSQCIDRIFIAYAQIAKLMRPE